MTETIDRGNWEILVTCRQKRDGGSTWCGIAVRKGDVPVWLTPARGNRFDSREDLLAAFLGLDSVVL